MTAAAVDPALAPAAPRSRTYADEYLALLTLVLGGYAIGGKGFAYLGIAPIYVGEVTLAAGLPALWYARRGAIRFARSPVALLLAAFMLFSAVRTVPFLSSYGIAALRDAALWGYATFSFIVGAIVVSRPARLSRLVRRFRRFIPVFLIAVPVMWPAAIILRDVAPDWPGTQTAILYTKAADFLVHLSGIAAFVSVGLAGAAQQWQSVLLTLTVGLTGFQSRGGLLAFMSGYAVAFVARPRSRTAWQIAVVTASLVGTLAVTGLEVRFPGLDRAISLQQFVDHARSTLGSSSADDLENTRGWRLAWWAVILDYTIGGPYRWMGKGYGVNLADDDGFQVTDDNSLRSPHNVHMTVLARSGVIGLALWVALQLAWLRTVRRARARARVAGDRFWSSLFTFVIAYWVAFLVNATFDVYLEGPMGGIWFWTLFGFGLAAALIYGDGHPETPPLSASGQRGQRSRARAP
ncbi:MAG TPA: O-antigen ligase family protein [Gemmatimonadaceae bacterium]|nr:O-antigen ligase family protein [Gemmatimonadaceae bacterium]